MNAEDLRLAAGLDIYEASITPVQDVTCFLGRRGTRKFVGCVGTGAIAGRQVATLNGRPVIVGPADHANAQAIRGVIAWARPRCIGLQTSIGLGDRLGLATPGHVRAVRETGLKPVFAQQSVREMTRTRRTPENVMDDATWGVLQEGFRDGFGSDADHLQHPEDVDAAVAAGFTGFTIDPGASVVDQADHLAGAALAEKYDAIDFRTLETSADDLPKAYVGRSFPLAGGGEVVFDETAARRAAVKYGNAVAHTAAMYRRLPDAAAGSIELEVSVDETLSPTSPGEHYFFAAELQRLGVKFAALAPRFIGRFEKGVDYIGDLGEFRAAFARHVAVMRTLGPYKISIHSGSDKFSIYPIIAELAGGMVHLKTAGTSYLEALRAVAAIDPPLFREILDFAVRRYQTDRASYHVSADMAKAPRAESMKDEDLPAALDDFHARQALHVTFGSVLTADGGQRFRTRIYETLQADEERHYAALAKHLGRHVAPFAQRQ